jgi:drug/metabolite transporter (DMT)-like permease
MSAASDLAGAGSIAARDRRLAEAAVLGVIVFWGFNFVAIKYLIGILPPVSIAFFRFAIPIGFLLVVTRLREGSLLMPRRDLVTILLLGALGFGVYQVLWATALRTMPAGESALIIAATPVLTALIASLAGTDALTREKTIGIAVSMIGVVVVVGSGRPLAFDGGLVGPGLTLLAAAAWATYVALGARLLRRHSPLKTSTWAIIGGLCVMAPFGLIPLIGFDLASVPATAWLLLLFSAFVSVAVANVVTLHGVRLLGPTRVTNYQFLTPFITLLLAAFLIDEPILPGQVIGGVVIGLGIVIARGDARRLAVRAYDWRPQR